MVDKSTNDYSVEHFYTIQKRLFYLYGIEGLSWREIARRDEYKGISASVLNDIVVKGLEPKNERTRTILGLPTLALSPVCPVHGIVHKRNCSETAKRRPRKPRMSEEEWDQRLAWLDNSLRETDWTFYECPHCDELCDYPVYQQHLELCKDGYSVLRDQPECDSCGSGEKTIVQCRCKEYLCQDCEDIHICEEV